ncbi:hypothetical protein ACIBF7_03050 [Nonomuraea sp. NPDC050478]|uniref:hypothetical protein n=1 Tax=Nonomuraea sp. NPDC050478 TaxID=3364365 RepID=UPI0037B205F9
MILGLVQAAIVSGAVSCAAIRHWIARAPQEVLEQLGAQRDRRTGAFVAPHPDTVCRTIAQVKPPAWTPPTPRTGPASCASCMTTPTNR